MTDAFCFIHTMWAPTLQPSMTSVMSWKSAVHKPLSSSCMPCVKVCTEENNNDNYYGVMHSCFHILSVIEKENEDKIMFQLLERGWKHQWNRAYWRLVIISFSLHRTMQEWIVQQQYIYIYLSSLSLREQSINRVQECRYVAAAQQHFLSLANESDT